MTRQRVDRPFVEGHAVGCRCPRCESAWALSLRVRLGPAPKGKDRITVAKRRRLLEEYEIRKALLKDLRRFNKPRSVAVHLIFGPDSFVESAPALGMAARIAKRYSRGHGDPVDCYAVAKAALVEAVQFFLPDESDELEAPFEKLAKIFAARAVPWVDHAVIDAIREARKWSDANRLTGNTAGRTLNPSTVTGDTATQRITWRTGVERPAAKRLDGKPDVFRTGKSGRQYLKRHPGWDAPRPPCGSSAAPGRSTDLVPRFGDEAARDAVHRMHTPSASLHGRGSMRCSEYDAQASACDNGAVAHRWILNGWDKGGPGAGVRVYLDGVNGTLVLYDAAESPATSAVDDAWRDLGADAPDDPKLAGAEPRFAASRTALVLFTVRELRQLASIYLAERRMSRSGAAWIAGRRTRVLEEISCPEPALCRHQREPATTRCIPGHHGDVCPRPWRPDDLARRSGPIVPDKRQGGGPPKWLLSAYDDRRNGHRCRTSPRPLATLSHAASGDLGARRTCACGARFYDLGAEPICPKCGTRWDAVISEHLAARAPLTMEGQH